jgi:hypothetical protein
VNIQQTIISGIKEQLFLNDYMVLPNFGGFVLKKKPAHINNTGTELAPPAKTVSFNSQFRQNDGILTLWLSTKLSCTPAESLAHLIDFSDYCNGVLQTRRRFSLPGVGFFYLDFENNICFEPQNDANFLRESFGLTPVTTIIPTAETEPRRTTVQFTNRITSEAVNHNVTVSKRNYQKVILPAAIVTLLCSMVLLVLSGTRLTGVLASSLGGNPATGTYQPLQYPALQLVEESRSAPAYVADANGFADLVLNDERSVRVKVLDPGVSGTVKTVKRSGTFEVVLGCFSVQKNAHRLVKKLARKNVNAQVADLNSKNLYIVSQVNFDTRDEALEALKRLKDIVPGAWLRRTE